MNYEKYIFPPLYKSVGNRADMVVPKDTHTGDTRKRFINAGVEIVACDETGNVAGAGGDLLTEEVTANARADAHDADLAAVEEAEVAAYRAATREAVKEGYEKDVVDAVFGAFDQMLSGDPLRKSKAMWTKKLMPECDDVSRHAAMKVSAPIRSELWKIYTLHVLGE